ncbi:MAG: hypothetical protein VYE58_05845, partial [Pseudomonadota bacterium]|nr:hypothetical protein [Pseudomonadota bacterium]
MSPPAFAAVLLVLAIGGVLAWLALSADKSDEPARDDVSATLTVELEGEIPEAPKAPEADSQAPESEETKTAAAPEPAVVARVEEAAAPKDVAPEKPAREDAAEVKFAIVAPREPAKEVIPLAPADPALLQETSRGALPI